MLDKKTDEEIKILRAGGIILGQILQTLAKEVKVGQTGAELNQLAEKLIKEHGGRPAFKHFQGFPTSLCVSVNQTVVHGIPNNVPFQAGDLVGLDLGLQYQGFYTDAAITVPIEPISQPVRQFIEVTKKALQIAIDHCAPDNSIGDIGRAIEKYVKPFGYGIIRSLTGHGVGRQVHEDPSVPNYALKSRLEKMFPGLVIAIEPMLIFSGEERIAISRNGWDAMSADNSLTAHFEHTVAVTKTGCVILTDPN